MLAAVEYAETEVFGADEDCADDVSGTGSIRCEYLLSCSRNRRVSELVTYMNITKNPSCRCGW